MTFSSSIDEYNGQRVVDYQNAETWEGPDVAYRLREEYDDEITIDERLDSLLQQPGVENLKTLVIGGWTSAYEGGDAGPIAAKLVEAASKLPSLTGMFFGDITYEETELSWIKQTDVGPILRAYPKLQTFGVRGGDGLVFSKTRHESLKRLEVQTGGLGRQTIREIFLCDFPNLEIIELYLGEENYGFDGSVEDFQPLLSGKLFPKLISLGLMNSEIADDLAAVVVNSPIVERLQVLDLSLGNISGAGVKSLHALARCKNLKHVDIDNHYASDEEIAELKKVLSCGIDAKESDSRDDDDEWRPIVHAE